MFQQLPESRATTRCRIGGTAVSVVAHAILVTGAVLLTANAATPTVTDTPPMIERFFEVDARPPEPAPPSEQAAQRVASRSVAAAALGAPALVAPIDIPLDIPPIDLSRAAPPSNEFAARSPRGARLDGAPGGKGTGPAIVDGAPFDATAVDKPVVLLPGAARPAYPEMLRQAGVGGEVVAEFVVDSTGRVEPGSLRIVTSDHELFSAAVRQAVPKLRFVPAEYAGGKVRQLVRLPFRFDLDR